MTVKELKEKLADLPDNMGVFMAERVSEFKYGLVNSAKVKEITFHDEDIWPKDKVLILDEQ